MDHVRRLLRSRLFTGPEAQPSASQIIGWWEARRLAYNLVVGLTGLLSILLVFVIAVVAEHVTGEPVGLPDPPLLAIVGVVAYGVMANVCYTGGWVAELAVRRLWGPAAGAFGEIAFALGAAFSVVLTLSPVVLAAAAAGINLGFHALGLDVDAPGVAE